MGHTVIICQKFNALKCQLFFFPWDAINLSRITYIKLGFLKKYLYELWIFSIILALLFFDLKILQRDVYFTSQIHKLCIICSCIFKNTAVCGVCWPISICTSSRLPKFTFFYSSLYIVYPALKSKLFTFWRESPRTFQILL